MIMVRFVNVNGFSQVLRWVLLFWGLFQVKTVYGSGDLKITLQSYQFSFEESPTESTPTTIPTSNLSVSRDFAKSYTPLWVHSSVFDIVEKPAPKNDSGNSTNVMWPWIDLTECDSPTRYRFVVCLDYDGSYDPYHPCTLLRVQTDPIGIDRNPFLPSNIGRETITFQNLLGTRENGDYTANPINVEFPVWKGPVRLSVFVTCCGEDILSAGQCNEVMSTTITTWPRPFVEGTQTMRYNIKGRGSLSIATSANCDPNFYGHSCDIFCKVDNPAIEHSYCNSSTGLRQCLTGWEGPDCQNDVNECENVMCSNGGTCKNSPGSFTCTCMFGTRGRLCQQRYPVCHLRPCQQQGTCLETSSGALCFCMPGFSGQWCHLLEGQEYMEKPIQAVNTGQLTTPISVKGKLTTPISVRLPPTTTTGIKVLPQGGKSNEEGEFKWHYWYLAVILGFLLLLVIIIIAIVLLFRAKVRKRYKITEPLPIPPPVIPTPIPLPKTRGFNNAVYEDDDPTNIIQPSTRPVVFNNNNNNINNLGIVQSGYSYDQDANGRIDFNDRQILTSKQNAGVGKSGGRAGKKTSDRPEVRSDHRNLVATYSTEVVFDNWGDQDINDSKNNKNKKQKGKKQFLKTGTKTNADDDEDFGFGVARRHIPNGAFTSPATNSKNVNAIKGDYSGHGNIASSPTTQFFGQSGLNPAIRNGQYESPRRFNPDAQSQGRRSQETGSKARNSRPFNEHEYEDIDTDNILQSFRPKPKPRSIHNVKSETLKRKGMSSTWNDKFDLSNQSQNGYNNDFLSRPAGSEDPSIILGIRRGSDGFITESSRPISARYDCPRHSDGDVTYNKSRQPHSGRQQPFNMADQGAHPSSSLPNALQPVDFRSMSSFQSPDMRDNTRNYAPVKGKWETPSYANTSNMTLSRSTNKDKPNSLDRHTDPFVNKPVLNSPYASQNKQPIYGNISDMQDPRLKTGSYVADVGTIPNSTSTFGPIKNDYTRQNDSSKRDSKGRRKSEQLTDIFRRRRTSELRGDSETAIDVNWWDEDDSEDDGRVFSSRDEYTLETTGAYAVSSFV